MFITLKDKIQTKVQQDIHFRELIKGSGISFVFQILGIVCGYIFTLLVTRNLSAEAWGMFTIAFTILQIASIVGRLGMDTALLRFVGEYSSTGNLVLVRDVYLKALKLVVPFSIFLSFILLLLSPNIAKYIFHKDYLASFFRITSIALVPFVLLFINRESIRGLKKIKEFSFLKNVSIPFLAFLILLLSLRFFKNNLLPLVVYVSAIFITFVLSLLLWLKNLKSKRFVDLKRSEISKTYTLRSISYKNLLSVSIPMLLSVSMLLIMKWTDTIMLGIFRSVQEVGIYSLAFKVSIITSTTLTAINTIAAPKFAEFWGKGDIKGLGKVARQSTRLIFWSSFPVLLILWIFPEYILSIFGENFRSGATVLRILTFGQFVNSISGSVAYMLQMTGKQKAFRNIILLAAIINIVLNYLMIPYMGIKGAAIASTISLIFWNIVSVIYCYKSLKINIAYVPVILK